MPFKIVRNDITKMNCDAIVNTANENAEVGPGCDLAIYTAAGYDEMLAYRKEHIGRVPEGQSFITPAFDLEAGHIKHIIHTVSPVYWNGELGEEERLRSCYKTALKLAVQNNVKSIAFPLIATGSYGYPIEEGMRIAVDEINAFLMHHNMMIYLVVFGTRATELGERLYPDLEAYIDHNYVCKKRGEEYGDIYFGSVRRGDPGFDSHIANRNRMEERLAKNKAMPMASFDTHIDMAPDMDIDMAPTMGVETSPAMDFDFYEVHESKLAEKMKHLSDPFADYLWYMIEERGMTVPEVEKKSIVSKNVMNKIKKNPDYHVGKMTALCLCVGMRLNLDESKDLLARAGYALSPCDKTDVIFSYFIENGIYDIVELDIQLEEHGLKCLIS